jgi:glycosyltransferase involved in cell wall biosynthesis
MISETLWPKPGKQKGVASMRIDTHVHSKYSKRPSQWILKKIGCPESFTEPKQVYHVAKSRGMTHVTITDHNSIRGAMEIAHLPDTFISEEITTYFPEDGCKIHVLALNISEAQHDMIQKCRPSIYELAVYLCQEKILNIVAHPLYAINDRLTLEHFERLLLLFNNFELNGARNERENLYIKEVLNNLTAKDIDNLSDKHNIAPMYRRPWEKRLYGGSDDHSSLNIARTYTRFDENTHISDPGEILSRQAPEVVSCPATPLTMAHNLYAIAYQFYKNNLNLAPYADKDILMRFLDRNLCIDIDRKPGLISKLYLKWQLRRQDKKTLKPPVSDSLLALLRHETHKLIHEDPTFYDVHDMQLDFVKREEKWFTFVNRVSKRVMFHFGNHLLDHLSGANFFNIFATIGSAGGLYTLLAPYFVAYSQFSKDRVLSENVYRRFVSGKTNKNGFRKKELCLAHFTDTFYEVNGVALTLQQYVHFALKNDKALSLLTCHNEHEATQSGVRNFQPIGQYELPEYPELKIFYPPLLEMLVFCYEKNFNHIHTATPGPIGLAALAIAKILKLPISGTYHTAIPQYAQILTGDDTIKELTWKYVLWYYDQLDLIYAPSRSTCKELIEKGLSAEKIKVYTRGIDIQRFNPEKRNGILRKLFDIKNGMTFIYVGRVSKEKNLHLLAEALRLLIAEGAEAHLVIVGEGPYYEDMQQEMKGLPCYFTGYLRGDLLAEVYASADLFVFPSATDTFGNVVLEAQASGIPVIVSDKGGPCENMIPHKTGLVVEADSTESLLAAMRKMVRNPERCVDMGRAARSYMETRSIEANFLKTWEMFDQEQTVGISGKGWGSWQ